MQNPSHTDFSTSTMFVKLKPSELIRSTIRLVKCWKFSTRWFQMAVIFSRNSSLFFQRVANAAPSIAMTPITIVTGLVMAAMALLSRPIPPLAPVIFVPRASSPLPREENAFIAPPTEEVSLPTTSRAGPIAAANAAILMMVFLVPSSIFCSFSTKAWTAATIFRMVGIRASPIWIISSCRADLRMVICPFRLSIIVAAIDLALPVDSSMPLVTVLKAICASSAVRPNFFTRCSTVASEDMPILSRQFMISSVTFCVPFPPLAQDFLLYFSHAIPEVSRDFAISST